MCAASNDGQRRAETIVYPSNQGDLLCIGSCDKDGGRAAHSAVGQQLDFLFQGRLVRSYDSKWKEPRENYTTCRSGTSFAAPHCVALIVRILAMIAEPHMRGKLPLITL